MKKLFTFFAAAVVSLATMANNYTGKITVTIDGDGTTQDATISIEQNEDETYKLSIKNFMLVMNETEVGVGNIVVDNLKGYTVDGLTTVVADQTITIEEGDDPNVDFWLGPMLPPVPIIMAAQFNDTNAKADIDIDMSDPDLLGQFIRVKFNPDIYGDVNKDGNVNAADVTAVYNIILGIKPAESN